jgi:hypothetical protein
MSTGRFLLEQYAKKDPKTQGYLQLYDTISACSKDPQECAKQEAKARLAQYLSEQTGIPAADLMQCFEDRNACAQNMAITAAAEASGVSPEVIRLAIHCAQTGDSSQCAKAGLILVAVAACTAYTSGAGTYVCTKLAPIFVNFAWPHIEQAIKIATFGVGLDGIINVLTFGQGIGFILNATGIGGLAKLLGGSSRGKFSDNKKRQVFHQVVRVTNEQVTGAIRGLWDGLIAARQSAGLHLPYGDDAMMKWAAERWANHHAREAALKAAVVVKQLAVDKAPVMQSLGPQVELAKAQQDLDWFY